MFNHGLVNPEHIILTMFDKQFIDKGRPKHKAAAISGAHGSKSVYRTATVDMTLASHWRTTRPLYAFNVNKMLPSFLYNLVAEENTGPG